MKTLLLLALVLLEHAAAQAIPLYHSPHSELRRRDVSALKSWALREKGRLTSKYPTDSLERRDASSPNPPALVRRASTSRRSSSHRASRTSSSATAVATLATGYANVSNYDADLEYFGRVAIGAPAQYMDVILDTGSADLWVAGATCTNTTGCAAVPTLNTTYSNTSVSNGTAFSVKYGSGSASGTLWNDYVSFAGYNVSGQTFAVADTITTDLLGGNLSGLLGLGWQGLAASGATPLWQNLFQAGVLPFPGFAFYLTRFSNISSAATIEPGGLLTLGLVDEAIYTGNITYSDVPTGLETYWLIPLEALHINGTSMNLSEPYAAIDTGTTLIGGPADDIAHVYAQINGSAAATGRYAGYYSYPCATDVNVSFTFANVSYTMSPDDFNLGPFGFDDATNQTTCLGAFFDLKISATTKVSWVIGAAFLKNVYSVFRGNPASVGFANLATGNETVLSNYTQSIYPNHPSNTSYGNSSDFNVTIPSGIVVNASFSESSSAHPTPTPVLTTEIQAGQTLSTLSVSSILSSTQASRAALLSPAGLGLTFSVMALTLVL